MMTLSRLESHHWPKHVLYVGTHEVFLDDGTPNPEEHREHIEPWLSALFQSEHLNLLVGSGLTIAVAYSAGANALDMRPEPLAGMFADALAKAAKESAEMLGRGEPNIEDQIRVIRDLISGLKILAEVSEENENVAWAKENLNRWKNFLDSVLSSFLKKILETERGIRNTMEDTKNIDRANKVRRLLGGFLLPFASRTGSRDRLHIFTTNYDRIIEYGCDLLGLRVIDRFVGTLTPVFQSSRLGIDLHYNPPGIRGEPRYLEGVVRFTKLHGSLDWRYHMGASGVMEVQRCPLPFGASDNHPYFPEKPSESVLIYPNPAKDIETLEYPYADLFRDFAAAVCQPNTVLVTYGYGFGDDHINRIIVDMLTIPSTHLVIISWDTAGGRLERFFQRVGRDEQITLLVGEHFGDLETLIQHYLPKPAIDRTTWRMMDLLKHRSRPQEKNKGNLSTYESAEPEVVE